MCHAFPTAVAAGLGLWPVRMLCGVSGAAESAGEQIVRADVCPLIKSMLGNAAEKNGLHAEIDLWIGLYTCDQMRRGLDSLASDLGREVHPIQLPATRTEEAAEYYAAQIRRFVADVEARHGLKFDEEKALRWQEECLRAGILLGLAARSGNIAPTDLHAVFHLYSTARPFGLADFLEKTFSDSEAFEAGKKIILAGSPLAAEDISILETLEEHGAHVIPLNCTGLNSVEEKTLLPTGGDTVRGLALGAFNLPPCARARPNAGVFERIGKELKSSGADGIIVKCLKFCDNWYTERERLAAAFDVPVLVVDSAYSNGENERLENRIEAFMETL